MIKINKNEIRELMKRADTVTKVPYESMKTLVARRIIEALESGTSYPTHNDALSNRVEKDET